MKSIYEATGSIYQNQGDYALPCIGTDETKSAFGGSGAGAISQSITG